MSNLNVEATAEPREDTASAGDPYAGKTFRQWWLVAVLTLAATLGTMDRQIVSLLLNSIKTDLGLSDTQASLVYGGAFALSNIVFLIPAGLIADRGSRRMLLGAGIAVWSAMGTVCGLAGSFVQLMLARAGLGFGESVIQPASVSMLRSGLPPERRGRGFSYFALSVVGGSALALLFGGALVHAISAAGIDSLPFYGPAAPWRIVLVLLGLTGLPVLLLLLTIREPAKPPRPTRQQGAGYGETLAYIRRHWNVMVPLLLFNPIIGMVTLSYGAWIAPVLIRVWGLSIPEVGFRVGMLMLVLPPVGLIVIGWLIDRMTRRHGARGVAMVAIPTVVIFGIIHTACPLMSAPTAFWVLLGAVMLVGGTCLPISNTVISLLVPQRLVGKVSAIQYILYGVLGATVGPMLVAIVSDRFLGGGASIGRALGMVSAFYAALAFVMIVLVERQLRSRQARMEIEAAS